MIAHPLDAQAALLASEDVKAYFRPVVYSLGDFNGFVLGVVRGCHASHGWMAVGGEVPGRPESLLAHGEGSLPPWWPGKNGQTSLARRDDRSYTSPPPTDCASYSGGHG